MSQQAAKPVQIACAANGAYLPHAGAMLASLFEHNRDSSFCVYLLHDDSTHPEELNKLKRWVESQAQSITFFNPSDNLPKSVPVHQRFSAAAWFRVLLPDLLKDLHRVLYLDVDLLVLDDIRPLWNLDLGENLVAACTNPFYPNMSLQPLFDLGIQKASDYFNSGVLLCDLDGLRRFQLSNKVFALAAERPSVTRYADQDPLNAILRNQVLLLDPTWNTQSPYYDLTISRLQKLGIHRNKILTARETPAVLHYSGPWKPWDYRCSHPLKKRYLYYRNLTPWAGFEVKPKSLTDYLWRCLSTAYQVQLTLLIGKISQYLARHR